MKKNILSPRNGICTRMKGQLTVHVWVYFWALLLPLIVTYTHFFLRNHADLTTVVSPSNSALLHMGLAIRVPLPSRVHFPTGARPFPLHILQGVSLQLHEMHRSIRGPDILISPPSLCLHR